MLKLLVTLSSESKKLNKENNNSIIKSKLLNMRKNHYKNNTTKSRLNSTKRMPTLMVWKKILRVTRKISLKKKKRIPKNGKNGKKPKRKESKLLKKKSRVLELKTIKFGKILTSKNKLIGNKSIMLIGLNGKWKSRAEKSTKSKEKKRDKNMKRNKSNMNNRKSSKNTSEKSNYATFWSHILTQLRKIGTELIKLAKTIKNKLSMLELKSLLILNGKIKRLRSFNLKSLKLKKKLQEKVARKTKTETKIKKKNKRFSISHTVFKINSNHWKFWLLLQSKKLIKKLKNWEKEKNCSKEDVKKNKSQKLTLSY